MRAPDQCLADLRERGYLVFEGFLEADELAAAQEGSGQTSAHLLAAR
jgi:hypothetical protein